MPASSLSRGLSLLELFTPDASEISIREMARRTGMPRSTTHRLVGDLVEWGALERGRKGVRLGVRLFERSAKGVRLTPSGEAALDDDREHDGRRQGDRGLPLQHG